MCVVITDIIIVIIVIVTNIIISLDGVSERRARAVALGGGDLVRVHAGLLQRGLR